MDLFETISEISNEQKEKANNITVYDLDNIPKESDLNLETDQWYQIKNVVSLYVDMTSSTQLTNDRYTKTSAEMFQLFTGSLVKILKDKNFEADFIDIKGDGGFALWKSKYASVKALIAAVTFRTLVEKELKPYVKNKIEDWSLSSHCGIAKGTVLVKRIGTRNRKEIKWNWAVWAGKPVNHSCKLSDIAEPDTLLATKNVYDDYSDNKTFEKYLIKSCGCNNNGEKIELWDNKGFCDEVDQEIFLLTSFWCKKHGDEYINAVLDYINSDD